MPGEAPLSEFDLDFLEPLDIIFSCMICQDSIRDIYKTTENNGGLRDGQQSGQGIVDKFWMTQCGHCICSKHVDDGAVPFYPAGQSPSMPCPECTKTMNDQSVKQFFPIRGYGNDDHDPAIPASFFECPPESLESSKMDNLRFQYMNLISYGTAMRKYYRQSERTLVQTKEMLLNSTRDHGQAQNQLHQMTERVRGLEARQKTYNDRKEEITHYLEIYPEMTTELVQLREELVRQGYQVTHRDYTYHPTTSNDSTRAGGAASRNELSIDAGAHPAKARNIIRGPSSTTMRGSSSETLTNDNEEITSSRKRRYSQYEREHLSHQKTVVPVCGEVVNTMPPPTVPASKSSPMRISDAYNARHETSQIQVGRGPSVPDMGRHPIPASASRSMNEPQMPPRQYRTQQNSADSGLLYMSGALPTRNVGNQTSQLSYANHDPHVIGESFDQNRDIENERSFFIRPQVHDRDARQSQVCQDAYKRDEGRSMSQYGYQFEPMADHRQRLNPVSQHPFSGADQTRQNRQMLNESKLRRDPQPDYHDEKWASFPARTQQRPQSVSQSVSSPFFRPGSSIEARLRTKSRAFNRPMPQKGIPYTTQQATQPTQRISMAATPTYSHSVNSLSFIQQPYSSSNQPLYEPPNTMNVNYRPASVVPQTPRDGNGLFTRPDYVHNTITPSSSHHFSQARPFPSAQPTTTSGFYDSRHSQSQPQYRPVRDEAMKVMKGAKGAGTFTGRNGLNDSQSAIREMFSGSRSGRRSIVRR